MSYSDDEANSIASYEDVGRRPHSEEPVVKGLGTADKYFLDGGEVPDVLYVVQYRGAGGKVVNTLKSNKPFDSTSHLAEDEVPGEKKPVIEIVNTVSTVPPPPRRYHHDEYYPDEDETYWQGGSATNMVIHSKHLRNALAAVVGYYPGVNFIGDRVSITAPYQVLVHHKKELELYKMNQPKTHDAECAATTAKHIDVLLSFLKTTLGDQIEEEERRWANSTPTATFDLLWLLMKPGEVVYKKEYGHWVPVVVSRVYPRRRDSHNIDDYLVEYWNVQYLDGRIQRLMESLTIHHFNGEQSIPNLPVIPARFFPGGAKAAAEKQIGLGKIYWELAKRPEYKEYDGPMVGCEGDPTGHLTARIIVDLGGQYGIRNQESYHRRPEPVRHRKRPGEPLPPPKDQLPQFKPHCPCASCSKAKSPAERGPFAGFEDLDPNKDEAPDNDLFFETMSDTVHAFILSERRWAMVKVENLKEVKPDREAFKHLVLDDEIKLTVRSLIGKFASSDGKVSPWPNDIVKNKGEGRIFLLHGSPGVGKTCTAECVAELTNRPLLSVTSGDLGTSMSASSVERNLDYFLRLGERYGALVLLDEADVYLEERRTRDLHRNGLVSVFLRALEYYKGVLFLTTNRVEAFDSAFTSRIHVALHYRELGDGDRLRVWANNFERLERDSGGRCYVPQSAREFAYASDEVRRLALNGREIRNALQTAVALAETDALEGGVAAVTVTDRHLRAVVKMSSGFREFLRKQKAGVGEADDDDGEEEEEEDSESDDDAVSSSDMGF
ncbi:P-loop containing nucleoside triphosphate hydrolase protein [Phialemonium atrogriseum]|uniref:P-loop containing nucleoside triphosphate hydrolase protein n=1 Tax=Phialemonium atrogriseum TaxID=1093897 RepID=A0AAJ0C1U5_9PEZI|nr:P-loop containing nucleoside triphosphate hydrolase protein [Phialemonium atrogriseum]KAK1767179.1 P-loop containing nucleoside triphosphate hydrolase protein [Phialemonium atrogriseum]